MTAVLGTGTGRRSGEDGDAMFGGRRGGGGGGGLFIPTFKSEEEEDACKWGVSGGEFSDARGRAVLGSGRKSCEAGGGRLFTSRASCSNLERRLFTAGGGSTSIDSCKPAIGSGENTGNEKTRPTARLELILSEV